MKFDELNQLKRFFSTMEITDEEKKKRCDLAYDFYDAIYFVFTIIRVEKEIEEVNFTRNALIVDQYRSTLENRITDVFKKAKIPYEDDYIPKLVDEIITTTNRHPEDMYYLSKERAVLIAQNEANTAINYADYVSAKDSGATHKRWIAELDDKTRPAHAEADGTVVPIDDYFYVGGDTLRFPHDYQNGSAENLINCRCICIYE